MSNIEKKDIREFRLRKIVLPLLLYYVMGIVAQLIFFVREMPAAIHSFIMDNETLFEGALESFEGLSESDAVVVFADNFTEEIYWEFLYTFTMRLVEMGGILTVLAAGISIPVFSFIMWKDRRKEERKVKSSYPIYSLLWVILGSVTLCIGLNGLITLSEIPAMDVEYEATSQMLYSMPLWLQIVGLGILVPMIEEILYRGIIFKRMNQYFNPTHAIVISGIIFAFVHGNIVQFIYALICGIAFAWLYVEYGRIIVPILAHCIMNLTSVLGSESDLFRFVFEWIGIVTVVSITMTSVFYVLIVNSKKGESIED